MDARTKRAVTGCSMTLLLGIASSCSSNDSDAVLITGGSSPTGGLVGSGGAAGAAGGVQSATGGIASGGVNALGGSSTGGATTNAGASTGGVGLAGSTGAGGTTTAGGTAAATGGGGAATGGTTASSGGSKSGTGGLPPTSGGAAAGGGAATGGAGGASKTAGCGATDHPSSGKATIDVSGTQREYILKLPSNYDPNTPYKLVFGWHWRGGTADNVANGTLGGGPYYGLEKRANGTAIFVSPNGIDNGWANTGGRDMAFLKAMLSFFNSKLCIDQARIFATGFSYGGMMSDAIGLDMADVFRAIAPMSGAFYSGGNRASTRPIAVWMSHSDADDVVPLADGEAALSVFLKNNGCAAETAPVSPEPCVAYQGCSTGHPVTYCKFSGGHAPPSFASQAIWEFFSQF
jgi:polyhydroxybutyrate depolymerase